MTRFLTCRIVPYLGSGELSRRSGGKDSVISIYQAFETADEPITLDIGNDNIWRRFWTAVGEPEVGTDPRLFPAAGRSVLAHLIDLEARGRVRRDGEAWARIAT